MHGGSMQSCLAMHSCPQWETIIGSLSHISKAWVWVGTCPSGCLPCVYHKLPPFYCVSIGRTAVHRGSMYTCLRMHGCSPWETTHWKIVNLSIACRWVGIMPLGLFTMCLAWISACSICFERGGDNDTWGFHAQVSAHAWLSPHKKLHIGTLLHLPNGSLCTDCVPQGLFTLWAASVNIYLLSFNRGDSRAWGVPWKVVPSCTADPHEKP